MRALFGLLSLLLVLAPAFAQEVESEEEKQQRVALLRDLEEAKRFSVDKKYKQAKEKYDEILTTYPENMEAHIGQMDILRSTKPEEAKKYAAKMHTTSKQESLPSFIFAGMNKLYEKDLDKAMVSFKTGADTFPEDAYLANYYQGYILFLKRGLDEAIPLLETALELNPDYIESSYLLGEVYLAKKNNAKVLEHWNDFLLKVPHTGTRYERVSKVVKQLGGR